MSRIFTCSYSYLYMWFTVEKYDVLTRNECLWLWFEMEVERESLWRTRILYGFKYGNLRKYDLRILWKFWFGIQCVLHDLMNSVPLIICEDLFLWNNDLMRWYWIWLRLKIWNGIHGRIFLKTLSMIWYLILLTSGDLTLTGSSSFTKRLCLTKRSAG